MTTADDVSRLLTSDGGVFIMFMVGMLCGAAFGIALGWAWHERRFPPRPVAEFDPDFEADPTWGGR